MEKSEYQMSVIFSTAIKQVWFGNGKSANKLGDTKKRFKAQSCFKKEHHQETPFKVNWGKVQVWIKNLCGSHGHCIIQTPEWRVWLSMTQKTWVDQVQRMLESHWESTRAYLESVLMLQLQTNSNAVDQKKRMYLYSKGQIY